MNWSEMQAEWGKLSGMVQSYWSRITDDDLGRIDGDRDKLAKILGERYRWEPDEVETRIATFEKEARLPGAVK